MRIAAADDSPMFILGVRGFLERMGTTVVAECANGAALLAFLDGCGGHVDAVTLDIRMETPDEGVEVAARIRRRWPHVGILVLSSHESADYAFRLLKSGNSHLGYLNKDKVRDPLALHQALRQVAAGGSVVDPDIVAKMVEARQIRDKLDRLTPRELEVLGMLAEGLSNQGICDRLATNYEPIVVKTLETHIARIFSKLDMSIERDVNRRVRAVLLFLQNSDGRIAAS